MACQTKSINLWASLSGSGETNETCSAQLLDPGGNKGGGGVLPDIGIMKLANNRNNIPLGQDTEFQRRQGPNEPHPLVKWVQLRSVNSVLVDLQSHGI